MICAGLNVIIAFSVKEGLATFIHSIPGGAYGKESGYNAGDLGLIPGLGRSPGEGNGNPLQYSCLENPMKEEPRGLQSMGCKESDSTERQRRKGKIFPFEYRVPKNSKER